MSNIPNNIKKMWEEAAKIKGPLPKDAGEQIKKAHFPKPKDKYDNVKKTNMYKDM